MKKKIFLGTVLFILILPAVASAQWAVSDLSEFMLPGASIYDVVKAVVNWILAIFAFFGIIGFCISGIIYLISTGDENLVERAKEAMKWSIIGVLVGLMGLVVITAIDMALQGGVYF